MKQGRKAGWHQEPVPGRGNKPKPDQQVTREVADTHGLQVRHDQPGTKLAEIITAAAQVGRPATPIRNRRRFGNRSTRATMTCFAESPAKTAWSW